jgi:hypothetical protein
MFLLTHEQWDSIWCWPDCVGERYFEVFDRFLDTHSVGQVVAGYHVPGGLLAVAGTEGAPARRSMMFRIHQLDVERGQVRVHPVAAVDPTNGALVSSPTEGSRTRIGAAVVRCFRSGWR